jgi:hypothetical protein
MNAISLECWWHSSVHYVECWLDTLNTALVFKVSSTICYLNTTTTTSNIQRVNSVDHSFQLSRIIGVLLGSYSKGSSGDVIVSSQWCMYRQYCSLPYCSVTLHHLSVCPTRKKEYAIQTLNADRQTVGSQVQHSFVSFSRSITTKCSKNTCYLTMALVRRSDAISLWPLLLRPSRLQCK